MIEFSKVPHLYINLYPDCIPVKGVKRSSICDLTRGNIFLFQSEYFEVLKYILSDRVENILMNLKSDLERSLVEKFINILQENEFISFQKDKFIFPHLNESWDAVSRIQNAIIDIKEVTHDYEKIFNELDELGCEFVQLRFFSGGSSLDELKRVVSLAKNKSIESLEIILKYDCSVSDEEYIAFLETEPIVVNLTLHSSPSDRIIKINYGLDDTMKLVFRKINLVSKFIDSELHCGVIDLKSLTPPSTATFLENKIRNGCLNGKVSIDCNGHIKNCPSMKHSYGHINETKIKDVVNTYLFQEYELINKDQVKVCRHCEFRYVCSDCRAYLEDPEDIYSKPLKCGFDPYSSQWENCFTLSKQIVMENYSLQIFHF